MGKKKARLSLFSTCVEQIQEQHSDQTTNEYHLLDNEYFSAFHSLDDIQQFHQKITVKQQAMSTEEEETDPPPNQDMDMKSFAQQYLLDLPEHITQAIDHTGLSRHSSQETFSTDRSINWSPKVKETDGNTTASDNPKRKSSTPIKFNNNYKKQRSDLPSSSNQIISEKMNSILVTLNDQEPSMIKDEPIESEQIPIRNRMGFGTSDYSGGLDNYVQNIHLLHQEPTSSNSSRPKRIRKQKKFFSDESEPITKPKRLKTSMRKKRSSPVIPTVQFTDAEIEQQFGERLSSIKTEEEEEQTNTQQIINSQVIIEFEPVVQLPQTPLEKARAKLTTALGRGHKPDTYLLKIRSREHKIIEVQLAIYGTADWYLDRVKILSRIEEALRGLRVSWTKIDIRVDDFDIQISTSSQATNIPVPSSVSNTNSSWFLKALSESGPLIVHIHDRRHPQQRFLIKCPCSECSPASMEHISKSSLPIVVNVSPATTPVRRLTTPTILNKTPSTSVSSLHNISTTFFNDLISQWGRNIVISTTQCVLDLALIVSVHGSLSDLCVSPNYSKEAYKKRYQQTIDPLQCTVHENENALHSKSSMVAHVVPLNASSPTQSIVLSKPPDILTFYHSIKQENVNIRNAKAMRNLITRLFSISAVSPTQSTIVKSRALILPKPASSSPQSTMTFLELQRLNEQNRRSRHRLNNQESKQQAHCTPIIELKPIITTGSTTTVATQNIHSFTRDSQTHELKKVTTIISTNSDTQQTSPSTNSARVIRLSITKAAPPPRVDPDLSSSHSTNKTEAVPLVPKQINIIKPLSSMTSAMKLSNPILISNKSQQP